MLSKYALDLGETERQRYVRKLTVDDKKSKNVLPDPYVLTGWVDDVKKWPPVQYPDIVNYLVYSKSSFTLDSFKAYKSLEAYNYFASGHVQTVFFHHINDTSSVHFLKAAVLSSQRVTDPPKQCWLCVHKDGHVVTAHCNCMAG